MIFCLPLVACAAMAPKKVAEKNLEAELILVGQVTEIGKVLLAEGKDGPGAPNGVFVLKTLHVIKGHDTVSTGELVRVVYHIDPKQQGPLVAETMGAPQVHVHPGNLVVVYIKPSKQEPFYKPIAGGSSVVVIKESVTGPSPMDKNIQ